MGGEGEGERGSHHGCGEERQKLSSHSEGRATSQENQRFFFLLHIASSPSLSSYKQYCFNHFIVISFPILNKMGMFYSNVLITFLMALEFKKCALSEL